MGHWQHPLNCLTPTCKCSEKKSTGNWCWPYWWLMKKKQSESQIVKQKISKEEDICCLRKRKVIINNDLFNEVDEDNTPDSIKHHKGTELCPILKSAWTESKKEHKTQPRKNRKSIKRICCLCCHLSLIWQ